MPDSKKVIAVNLAGDMLDRRFGDNGINSSKISYEQFLKAFGSLQINNQLEQYRKYVLFLFHIYSRILALLRMFYKMSRTDFVEIE